MGCNLSTANNAIHFHADKVDDSIHAMLSKEARLAKARGEQPHSYRPRATHPLLQRNASPTQICCEEDDDFATEGTKSVSCSLREDVSESDVRRLMFHTKHHCDTVDRRDIPRSDSRVVPGAC